MDDSKIVIIGARGQLATAFRERYPRATVAGSDKLDITNEQSVLGFDWAGKKIILNAAAYTNVDGAETAEGRVLAWQTNASGVNHLPRLPSRTT
jgi:dTDP-4-dehydrorhamnose 3,5-epimerase